MKNNYRVLVLTLLWCGLLYAGAASAQDSTEGLKVGVVDLARLVNDSPQAERAKQRMESRFSSRREKLQTRSEALRNDIERLKRDGAVMSQEAREELEAAIREQQRQLQLAQSKYNDDVAQAEQEEFTELRDAIRDAIQTFAGKQNYDLILGDSVLYATEAIDVTDEILSRLSEL